MFVMNLLGAFFFATDILLLSASIWHLHLMLELCVEYDFEHDIIFDGKNYCLMQIGLVINVILPNLWLNNVVLQWVFML